VSGGNQLEEPMQGVEFTNADRNKGEPGESDYQPEDSQPKPKNNPRKSRDLIPKTPKTRR